MTTKQTSCVGGRHNMPAASWPFDLESGVLPVPILVFLGLSVLNLGPMYATNVRRASSLNAPYPRSGA